MHIVCGQPQDPSQMGMDTNVTVRGGLGIAKAETLIQDNLWTGARWKAMRMLEPWNNPCLCEVLWYCVRNSDYTNAGGLARRVAWFHSTCESAKETTLISWFAILVRQGLIFCLALGCKPVQSTPQILHYQCIDWLCHLQMTLNSARCSSKSAKLQKSSNRQTT